MTRVWIINHFAIPPSESGGTRHFSLARELMEHGFEPTIIAAASNYQTGKPRALPEGAQAQLQIIQNVPFLWLRAPTHGKAVGSRLIGMLHFAWQILNNLPRKFVDAPQIIIGSTPHLFSAAASCFLARHLKVPFVLEVRDLWPESLIELGGYSRMHPAILAMKWLERYVYKNAARIVTLLPDAAPYFAQFGVDPSKVIVLPNGVDTVLLDQPLPPPAAHEGFNLLYAGSIGIPNQMETFIEAAAILKKRADAPLVKFVLIGDGIRKVALQAMAEEQGLENVIFAPPVPKHEVPALLARADACYLQFKDSELYRWGVSPNKLYDYFLAGKPVVYAANLRSNPVKQEHAGVALMPGDAQGLADAVCQLAALSPEDRTAMGQRGRAYVLANHNFKTLGKKLADGLREIL